MALYVTQCPSCDSSFNTSARVLLVAHGLVRCGACLSVFEASENFILPDEVQDAGESDRESVFISGREDFLDVARFIRTASGLNETSVQFDPAEQEPDDSVAEFNDAIQAVYTDIPVADVELTVPEPEFHEAAVEPVNIFPPEISREDEPERTKLIANKDSSALRNEEITNEVNTDLKQNHDDDSKEEGKEVLRARLLYTELEESSETLLPLSDQDLDAIRQVPDPLELEHRIPPSHWRRNVGYSLLSLVLLLSLNGLFLWQRFELLSLHPDLRPVYQLACNILGCSLPFQEDLRNMQIENLVVRSHPQRSDALVVSAVLRNTATFQQPFPILRLQFRDPALRPVAGRDFQPVEYLPATLHSVTNIPVNTPVQFSIELVDPGTDAVNYELIFISRYL